MSLGLKSVSAYCVSLGLDEADQGEEVADELEKVERVWRSVVGEGALELRVTEGAGRSVTGPEKMESVFESLITELGTTYSEEEHGDALRGLLKVVSCSVTGSTGESSGNQERLSEEGVGVGADPQRPQGRLRSVTPVSRPPLPPLAREVSWGRDPLHRPGHPLLCPGFPAQHNSYHMAADALLPQDLRSVEAYGDSELEL